MPREYVGHRIRQRSQELATQVLGLRRERVAMRRIGIDVGGTNTDAVLLEDGRVVHAVKTPTTSMPIRRIG